MKCKYGAFITDFDYSNKENELGEEYGVVTAFCKECGADYEFSEWGHFEDRSEAQMFLTLKLENTR